MSGPNPVLVYMPTGEVVSSNSSLRQSLMNAGWEMSCGEDTDRIMYRRKGSPGQFEERISVPLDFSELTSVDMYNIVLKNPNSFSVRLN